MLLLCSLCSTCELQGNDEKQAPKRVKVTQFTVGSVLMNELMPAIMKAAHEKPILKEKLYQVNFHTTLSGEAMVTLIYHKKLNDNWKTAAEELRASLSSLPSSTDGIVQVIGRSRGQKLELTCSHVDEVMTVAGKQFSNRQVEGAFSQPNGGIVSACLFCLQAAALLRVLKLHLSLVQSMQSLATTA